MRAATAAAAPAAAAPVRVRLPRYAIRPAIGIESPSDGSAKDKHPSEWSKQDRRVGGREQGDRDSEISAKDDSSPFTKRGDRAKRNHGGRVAERVARQDKSGGQSGRAQRHSHDVGQDRSRKVRKRAN